MATKVETHTSIENNRYLNCMDEAYDLLFVYMSPNLLFHIEACTTPYAIWKNMENLFGKQDEMRGHMMKVELNSIDPRNFYDIQDFFTKFNSLLLHINACVIDKST